MSDTYIDFDHKRKIWEEEYKEIIKEKFNIFIGKKNINIEDLNYKDLFNTASDISHFTWSLYNKLVNTLGYFGDNLDEIKEAINNYDIKVLDGISADSYYDRSRGWLYTISNYVSQERSYKYFLPLRKINLTDIYAKTNSYVSAVIQLLLTETFSPERIDDAYEFSKTIGSLCQPAIDEQTTPQSARQGYAGSDFRELIENVAMLNFCRLVNVVKDGFIVKPFYVGKLVHKKFFIPDKLLHKHKLFKDRQIFDSFLIALGIY